MKDYKTKTKEDFKESLVFQRDLAKMLGQEVKALQARLKEMEEEKSRLRPCRGCPTVECTCFSELEDYLLADGIELKRENARLQKLVDMNQKVVDAAREIIGKTQGYVYHKNFGNYCDALRELDGTTTNVSSK